MGWLPGLDSNQGQGIQSPLCYHYTTGQIWDWERGCRMVTLSHSIIAFAKRPLLTGISPLFYTDPKDSTAVKSQKRRVDTAFVKLP